MLRKAPFFSLLVISFLGQAQILPESKPYSTEEHRQLVSELIQSLAPKIESPDVNQVEDWQAWRTVDNYTFGKNRGSLPMIADLDALHPYFREKVEQLISICKAKGIELALVETYRTHAKQNEYKAMGKKYTRSVGGHSKHQYGLAVDVVPIKDSVARWDDVKLWKKVGTVGEQLGLRWGGRWRNPYDPGHFEWTGGLTSYHLATGLQPQLPKTYRNPCLEEELASLYEGWQAWEAEQATLASKPLASANTN
ncbi:MAG: M15 family metallopeptidase [Cyclobacteriaceae bacterium]|nr:M15 family metallopeptidase [Cyclobacteriaceae bacterium]MBX2916964.1 M15 family metallopeptidase [Cyclobacteriaceae bacterium]